MEKKQIAEFFDQCAPWWDSDMIRNEPIIEKILDNAGIRQGISVLDVACGTGVLFTDYLKRGVAHITGIDISPEMAKLAAAKFPEVTVVCGDVEEYGFDRQFDTVMLYNAFPHFPDPQRLIQVLAGLCKPGGRLCVAHGMSRHALAAHHAGRASKVSIDLLHERELAALMERWFQVDVVISNGEMYQVCGVRLEGERSQKDISQKKPQPSPMEEMVALMGYMVSHNDAHAQELTELAQQLKAAGKTSAYRDIMGAVADFDVANARLRAVCKQLAAQENG